MTVAAVTTLCTAGLAAVVEQYHRGGEAISALATAAAPADRRPDDRQPLGTLPPTPTHAPARRAEQITYPQHGDGRWAVAPGGTAVAGTSGELLRYRVAVEGAIANLDVAAFAAEVSATLADPHSWTGAGRFRLQRVDASRRADFVVFLATPRTRSKLCGSADTYTSCRNGDRVVLNVARWVHGAVAFTGDLASYRQYVVNHEVGHRLGEDHERCPGRGEPAPVMQQQTLGLHGCRPNSWPLRDGDEYHGPAGAYDDPAPDDDGA